MSQFKDRAPGIVARINKGLVTLIDGASQDREALVVQKINDFRALLEREGNGVKGFQVTKQTHIGAKEIAPDVYRDFQRMALNLDRVMQILETKNNLQSIINAVNDLAVPMVRVLGRLVLREHVNSFEIVQNIIQVLHRFGVQATRSKDDSTDIVHSATGTVHRTESEMRQDKRGVQQGLDESVNLDELEKENESRRQEDMQRRIAIEKQQGLDEAARKAKIDEENERQQQEERLRRIALEKKQAEEEADRQTKIDEENERRQQEERQKKMIQDLLLSAFRVAGASLVGGDNWFDEGEVKDIFYNGVADRDQALFSEVFDKNIEVLKSRVKVRSDAWDKWKTSDQVKTMIDALTRGERDGIKIRSSVSAADLIQSLQDVRAQPEYFIDDETINSQAVQAYQAAQASFFDTTELVNNINAALSSYGIVIGANKTNSAAVLADLPTLAALVGDVEHVDATNDVAVKICNEQVAVQAKQFSDAIASALMADIDTLLNDEKAAQKLPDTINKAVAALKDKKTTLFVVAAPKVLAWLFDGLDELNTTNWKELEDLKSVQNIISVFKKALNKVDVVGAYWTTLVEKKDPYCNNVFIDTMKSIDLSDLVGLAKFYLMTILGDSDRAKKSFATSWYHFGYQNNPIAPIIKEKLGPKAIDLAKLADFAYFMMAVEANSLSIITNKVGSADEDFVSILHGAQGGVGKSFNMATGKNADFYSSDPKKKDFSDFAAKEANINPIVLYYFLVKVLSDKKTEIVVAPYNEGNILGNLFTRLPMWLQKELKRIHAADGRIKFKVVAINNVRLTERAYYNSASMQAYYEEVGKIISAIKTQELGDCSDELSAIYNAGNEQKDPSEAIGALNVALSKVAKKMKFILMVAAATDDGLKKKVDAFLAAGIPVTVVLSIVKKGADYKEFVFYEKLLDIVDAIKEKIPGWIYSTEKKKYEKEVEVARKRIEADKKKWQEEKARKDDEDARVISSGDSQDDQVPAKQDEEKKADEGQVLVGALVS